METRLVTAAERPTLSEEGAAAEEIWPEYNLHGEVPSRLWPRLYADLPGFQFGLVEQATDELVAKGHTVPCAWDGTEESLSTFDATLAGAFALLDAGGTADTLCAASAEIPPHHRGRGLARVVLEAMAALADRAGLARLIAPVRPSLKHRYPTIPIARYAAWRREDGQLFDPWMRVHERLGARLGPTAPHSLQITGTVGEWETWTGLAFPDTGDYVFPEGLAPVSIDRRADTGIYWEPNVWMIHR